MNLDCKETDTVKNLVSMHISLDRVYSRFLKVQDANVAKKKRVIIQKGMKEIVVGSNKGILLYLSRVHFKT